MSDAGTDSVRAVALKKTYSKSSIPVEALRGVDLTVAKGEFMAIVGPSGSGKTTLLNLLGALDSPTGGEIFIEGRNITSLSSGMQAEMRLRRIGFVFQEFNLIPVLTAIENVEYVMLLQGLDRKSRQARSRAILREVGLEGLEDKRPGELSGGQQQRVAVARAIVTEPAIVLADEPTANLDSGTAASLFELMKKLNRDKQVTIIVSTHDPMLMERASRVVQMRDGSIDQVQ